MSNLNLSNITRNLLQSINQSKVDTNKDESKNESASSQNESLFDADNNNLDSFVSSDSNDVDAGLTYYSPAYSVSNASLNSVGNAQQGNTNGLVYDDEGNPLTGFREEMDPLNNEQVNVFYSKGRLYTGYKDGEYYRKGRLFSGDIYGLHYEKGKVVIPSISGGDDEIPGGGGENPPVEGGENPPEAARTADRHYPLQESALHILH